MSDKTIDCKYAEEVVTIRGGKTVSFCKTRCGVTFYECIGTDICPFAEKECEQEQKGGASC